MPQAGKFTQEGQEEYNIIFKDLAQAELIRHMLENKEIGNVWIEPWTGGMALRIEVTDKEVNT